MSCKRSGPHSYHSWNGFHLHLNQSPKQIPPKERITGEVKPVAHTTLHTASRTNLKEVSAVQGHGAIASTIHVACRTARGRNRNNVKVRHMGEEMYSCTNS
jgi:hypothetical protein